MRSLHPCLHRLMCSAWAVAVGLTPGLAVSAAPAPAPGPPAAGTLPKNVKAALADVALESAGGGRLRHRGQGFTAIIHPDGSVEFRDYGGTADFNFFGLDLFRRRFREPEPERHSPAWTGVLERTIFPQGRLPIAGGLSGRFGGLADGPRKDRHRGEKRAFMAATEKLRFEMANRWYSQRMHSELADLGSHLVEVWRDKKLPLAERKRRIFERWADCEEPGPSHSTELDALRAEVARTARAKIEAFVRQVAPRGSREGYSQTELDRLNRGRGAKAQFRPYDAPVVREEVVAMEEKTEVETPTGSPSVEPLKSTAPPEPAVPVGPDPEPGWFRPADGK